MIYAWSFNSFTHMAKLNPYSKAVVCAYVGILYISLTVYNIAIRVDDDNKLQCFKEIKDSLIKSVHIIGE